MRLLRVLTAAILVSLASVALACGEEIGEAKPTPPAASAQVPAPATPAAMPIQPSPTPTAVPPAPPTPVPTPSATAVPTSTPTPTSQAAAAQFPLTLFDGNGNEVIFEKPPERIVAIDSAVVETLFAIGEGHRVVATHDFVTYPPETADIPRVGDAFNMNLEATLDMDPDLVFVFSGTYLPDLERMGLRVLYLESLSDDFRKVADNIRMWGRITGSTVTAEAVASQFEVRVAKIEEVMATQGDGPSVFQDEGGLWTPGPDTLIGEVFELLKLQNTAYDVSGYAQLSPEVIVERGPELIIASYGDDVSDDPAFQNLPAVKNGRVYVPRSDALSVAGPRYIDGIEELAEWVYPDIFE